MIARSAFPLVLRLMLVLAGTLALASQPLHAETVIIETMVEYWVDEDTGEIVDTPDWAAEDYAYPDVDSFAASPGKALGRFGPFVVTAPDTAEMYGTVGSNGPDQLRAMLRAYPGIRRLVMVECPGSVDDEANLRMARILHAAGISTHVPENGSVRSGAVELFLAGVRRTAAPGAEFAVHSWRDANGVEAWESEANQSVHREYLDYYRDMGLSAEVARKFYAFTNSVAHDDAVWLGPRDMAAFGLIDGDLEFAPVLALLD